MARVLIYFLISYLLNVVDSNCSEGCLPNFSCNPYDNKCYENPTPSTRPSVWLGEAPDKCDRTEKHCELFGLNYDSSHPKGDGEFCRNGTKVRCLVQENIDLETTPSNEFRYVTYNIFERDFAITYDGQRERSCRIIYWMIRNHPNIDAFSFQETFMGGCFSDDNLTLRDMLTYYGFEYYTQTIESDSQPSNGGIFIASRWPIAFNSSYVYTNYKPDSWDSFAAKGIVYAKVIKTVNQKAEIYHLGGTHLQSGKPKTYQSQQCKEIAEFFGNLSIPETEAVLIGGDFNLNQLLSNDTEETENLIKCMEYLNANIPVNTGPLNATTDPTTNDLLQILKPNKTKKNWIDYVLPSISFKKPIESSQTVLQPKASEKFPICLCERCIPLDDYIYPDDPECGRVVKISHLADHYPVLGKFVFQ
ncbi:unnamed protein product [Dimorphilus gyrociliatus]|uniref:sphingomyelin phosphodiesterase n=1 Tax=Dimorphilus gyrociliatus TaxID=2664684 RepID=A0A7I8VT96_9ANNE|nr:unnamed protein product [Dimorphilus gyrociliatus]